MNKEIFNILQKDIFFKEDKKAFTELNRLGIKILRYPKKLESFLLVNGFNTNEIKELNIYKNMKYSRFEYDLYNMVLK